MPTKKFKEEGWKQNRLLDPKKKAVRKKAVEARKKRTEVAKAKRKPAQAKTLPNFKLKKKATKKVWM